MAETNKKLHLFSDMIGRTIKKITLSSISGGQLKVTFTDDSQIDISIKVEDDSRKSWED